MADVQQRALFVTKIGNIEVDSCLEESHTFTNTVTDHPVESGSNISDHCRPDPDVVNLRCFVSNTPLSTQQVQRAVRQGSTAPQSRIGEIAGRGNDTYTQLQKMRTEGTLLTLVTSLRTYGVGKNKMVIQSLAIPRTRQNFEGLEFSVTLKEIRIVETKATTLKQQKDTRTRPKTDKGAKTTQQAPLESKASKQTGWGEVRRQ